MFAVFEFRFPLGTTEFFEERVDMAKSFSERTIHLRNAYNEAKQAPFLSSALLVLAFVIPLMLEEVWAFGVDRWKPDYLRSESEIAAENLTLRTKNIASSVGEIEAILEAMRQGDDIDGVALEQKMTELLNGIDNLTPQLAVVSDLRTDLLRASLRQKTEDLSSTGYSAASDIRLFMNQGITICSVRYTIAVSGPDGDTRLNPTFTLSAPDGRIDNASIFKVGRMLTLPSGDGVVSITYNSHEVVNNRAIYGVNFSCPA